MWVLAWFCAGLIPAGCFAARDGQRATARAELAIGLAGTAGFTWIGLVLW
jgi:hypothetical protein